MAEIGNGSLAEGALHALNLHCFPFLPEQPPISVTPLLSQTRYPEMPSEQDIYEEHVLDHWEDPYHRGECDRATHAEEGNNPLCGDQIRIELRLDSDGKVKEAWFDGKGCVISQASASMLVERIEGLTVAEVKEFSANEMLDLFGPKLTPNRQKCCLLSWRIVQAALHAPLDDEDPDDSTPFAGPHLGEES